MAGQVERGGARPTSSRRAPGRGLRPRQARANQEPAEAIDDARNGARRRPQPRSPPAAGPRRPQGAAAQTHRRRPGPTGRNADGRRAAAERKRKSSRSNARLPAGQSHQLAEQPVQSRSRRQASTPDRKSGHREHRSQQNSNWTRNWRVISCRFSVTLSCPLWTKSNHGPANREGVIEAATASRPAIRFMRPSTRTMPHNCACELSKTFSSPATPIACDSNARRSPGGSCRASSSCCGLPDLNDPLLGAAAGPVRHGARRRSARRWIDVVYLTLGKMTRRLAHMAPSARSGRVGSIGQRLPAGPHRAPDHGRRRHRSDAVLWLSARSISVPRKYGEPARPMPRAKRVTLCYGVRHADLLAGVAGLSRGRCRRPPQQRRRLRGPSRIGYGSLGPAA